MEKTATYLRGYLEGYMNKEADEIGDRLLSMPEDAAMFASKRSNPAEARELAFLAGRHGKPSLTMDKMRKHLKLWQQRNALRDKTSYKSPLTLDTTLGQLTNKVSSTVRDMVPKALQNR